MTIPSTAKIYMHQTLDAPADWTFDLETTSTPVQGALESEIAKKLDEKTSNGKHLDKVLTKTIPYVIKLKGPPKTIHTLSVKVVGTNIHIVSKRLEYRLSLESYSYRVEK
jgi:hypothetical protein